MAQPTACEVRGGKKGKIIIKSQNGWKTPGVDLIRRLQQQECSPECPAPRHSRQRIGLTSRLSVAAWAEEFQPGYSGKSGSRRVVGSLPHEAAKAIMSKKVFLFRTNLLGTHGVALGSRSSKRWHGMKTEPLWLLRWVVRLGWTVLFEIAAAPSLPRFVSLERLVEKGREGLAH